MKIKWIQFDDIFFSSVANDLNNFTSKLFGSNKVQFIDFHISIDSFTNTIMFSESGLVDELLMFAILDQNQKL